MTLKNISTFTCLQYYSLFQGWYNQVNQTSRRTIGCKSFTLKPSRRFCCIHHYHCIHHDTKAHNNHCIRHDTKVYNNYIIYHNTKVNW